MSIYEEVEIEDLTYVSENEIFVFPCPCGDKFAISVEELRAGEDIAHCPSCTLKIRVIVDDVDAYLDKFLAEYNEKLSAGVAVVGALGA